MRVAIVSPILEREDGQGRVNVELARDLLARGHSLMLVSFAADRELRASASVRWMQVGRLPFPTFLLRELVFSVISTAILARYRSSVDLIVVNGFVTWWRSDINLVHFVHRSWLQSASHPSRHERGARRLYRWIYTALNAALERFSFARSRVLVAVSKQVRRQLISGGVAAEKIHVVPNGVDLSDFAPGPGDRASFQLPEGEFVAMFAGDIRSTRKNLDTVLDALVRSPDIHLAVAGNPAGSPYPARARSLRIADRVHFLGLRSDIAALMRTADAFIFPSRFEPFGLVLLEASACGLPVITARTVGACEALAEDGMVVLDDPDDVGGMVEALRSLSTDPALRQRMGRCARAAAERLSWQSTTARYSQIIECVGARGGR
jgi:glycosyltransferase involved in cell wall biosynthesis